MEEKFVLDTCIVLDLIQYHKDKIEKFNNGIEIKAVYEHLVNLDYDGVSKCYVTIYSIYEILKNFNKNFNENFLIFKTILCPQNIIFSYTKEFINDHDLVNLDEKDENFQEKVKKDLRNLIVNMYSGVFSDIFLGVLLTFVGIMEQVLPINEARELRTYRNIEEVHVLIRNKLKKEIGEHLESKRKTVKYLNNEYIGFMKMVFCFIAEINRSSRITWKTLNKNIITFINTLKTNQFDVGSISEINIFTEFFNWLKNENEDYRLGPDKLTDNELIEKLKAIVVNKVKNRFENNGKFNDDVFYSFIEKLYFRDFKQTTTRRRDPTYNFGVDLNDIVDYEIILSCKKVGMSQKELPLLSADRNMRKLIDKYLTSSQWLYEKFDRKDKDDH